MNFLKRIWRKIFRQKVGVHDSSESHEAWMKYIEANTAQMKTRYEMKYFDVYDPSLDEEKILKGESESYFE